MAKDVVIIDTITRFERLRNSVNGNPRFRLLTEENGQFTTQSDAMINYEIENGVIGFPVRITMTPAHRVWNIERI